MIWVILKVILFTAILKSIINYLTNYIFFVLRRMHLWIVSMFVINLTFFFIGSVIQDSFNAVWWSACLTLLMILPLTKKRDRKEQAEVQTYLDELYMDMGLPGGRVMYIAGIVAFAVGGIIGCILFYGQIISI